MATAEGTGTVPEGKLELEIVTSKGVALKVVVDEVTAPGLSGEFGVLAGHLPLLSALRAGIVTYRTGGETKKCAVAVGVAEVGPDKVLILSEDFTERPSIDPVLVRKELGEVVAEMTKLQSSTAAEDDEAASEARRQLIKRENWLAAQLELYGDPPPAAMRTFEEFGPPPLPADEEAEDAGTRAP